MVCYTLHVFEAGDPTPTVHRIDCAGDSEAINSALDIAHGRAVELWADDRRVLISPPLAPAAPPLGRQRCVKTPSGAGLRRGPIATGLPVGAR